MKQNRHQEYRYDVDAVIFKHEDYRQGTVIGPVWIRRGGTMTRQDDERGHARWVTYREAAMIAAANDLPLFEV